MRIDPSHDSPRSYEAFAHATSALRSRVGSPMLDLPPIAPVVVRDESKPSFADVIGHLSEAIDSDVLTPILTCDAPDVLEARIVDWVAVLGGHLRTFSSLMELEHRGRLREIGERASKNAIEWLCHAAHNLSGEAAGVEAHFCASTWMSALEARNRVIHHGKPGDPALLDEWQKLAIDFRIGGDFHALGVTLLLTMATGRRGTELARDCALESLRFGALSAYAAARTAESLVTPTIEDTFDLSGWSEDDQAIASGL